MASKTEAEFYIGQIKYKINKAQVLFTELYQTTDKMKNYEKRDYSLRGYNKSFPPPPPSYSYTYKYGYMLNIYMKGRPDPIQFKEMETEEKSLEECEKTLMEIENLLL